MNKLAYAALLIGLTASVSTDVFAAPAKAPARKGASVVGEVSPGNIPSELSAVDSDLTNAVTAVNAVAPTLSTVSGDITTAITDVQQTLTGFNNALTNEQYLLAVTSCGSSTNPACPMLTKSSEAATAAYNAIPTAEELTSTLNSENSNVNTFIKTTLPDLATSLKTTQSNVDGALNNISGLFTTATQAINCAQYAYGCVGQNGNGTDCDLYTSNNCSAAAPAAKR